MTSPVKTDAVADFVKVKLEPTEVIALPQFADVQPGPGVGGVLPPVGLVAA